MYRSSLLLLLAMMLFANLAHGASLLTPGDPVIAIDTDAPASHSSYMLGEGALSGIDGNSGTKYDNNGLPPVDLGLIVQPFVNVGTVVRSIQFTTANESFHRNPSGWKLYGTNDPITSVDNGTGSNENWHLIAQNSVSLPSTPFTPGPAQSFSNATAYNNYRIQITGVQGPTVTNGMQFSDVQVYTDVNAGGIGVFTAADNAIAFQLPQTDSFYDASAREYPASLFDVNPPTSRYNATETPQLLIDGLTSTKYGNFGAQNAGFIVTPQTPSRVQSFKVATPAQAGQTPTNRLPTSWVLYGTNNSIVSTDNSKGLDENWTLIDQGSMSPPLDGSNLSITETYYPTVNVNNPNTYSSYKMLWPTTVSATANFVHLSEAQFFTQPNAAGTEILHTSPAPPILAVDPDNGIPQDSKYFNRGETNSGFVVTPSVGASVVTSFQVSTADGNMERDPMSWILYGTNDSIVDQDNSQGSDENWTQIATGAFSATEMPTTRKVPGTVISLTNALSFKSYRMVFPTVRDSVTANGMQISDIQFFGNILAAPVHLGDFNNDGKVDAADYTVWRDAFGAADETALHGNGDGGGIALSDFNLWKTKFGTVYAGSGGIGLDGVAGVPEPSTFVLLVFGMMLPWGFPQIRARFTRS